MIAENSGCSTDNKSLAVAAGQTVDLPAMKFLEYYIRRCFDTLEDDSQGIRFSQCSIGAIQSLGQVPDSS